MSQVLDMYMAWQYEFAPLLIFDVNLLNIITIKHDKYEHDILLSYIYHI